MTITYVFEGSLYVNITNRCPNNCEFCLRQNTDKVGDSGSLWLEKEPTKEEIWAEISFRALSAFPEIVFCGYGEPTCRLDDMLWVCSKIRKVSDIPIRVNTNGLSDLINRRPTAKDFDNLVDIMSISLNASNAKLYDEICHSEFGMQAFDAILSFTKKVSMFVPKVYLSVVNKDTPIHELNECEKICNSIGATFKVREYID